MHDKTATYSEQLLEWLHDAEMVLLLMQETPFLRETEDHYLLCPACGKKSDAMDALKYAHNEGCIVLASLAFSNRLQEEDPTTWQRLLDKRMAIARENTKRKRIETLKQELSELETVKS